MNKLENEKNDRREIFGWLVYDWANSVFFTTVVGVLIGQYITTLAQQAVGENGVVLSFGGYNLATAKSLFPYAVGLSVFLQIFFLPVMGAIADYTHLKKTFMAFFCYLGAIACCLLFFVQGNLYILGSVFFIVANLSAGASIVFYNSYLSDITTEDKRDKVSSWGFAAGYISGALVLFANLIFLKYAESYGISTGMAVRICILTAGIWWGGFALITFAMLRTREAARTLPTNKSYFRIGIAELGSTFGELRRLRHTLRYLIGYLFYNDGIQTVIGSASVFLAQELFVARGLEAPQSFLLGIFLMAQFVAFGGALIFERIAAVVGTKRAILLSLLIWAGIVIYAYGFFRTETQAWVMTAAIAFVLGGSQALSRSLFSRMIPKGREASFFGIYEISERGTSWLGPLIFSIVVASTGSYRQAILSLIFFFVIGIIILLLTDTDRAVHEAGNALPEEIARRADISSKVKVKR